MNGIINPSQQVGLMVKTVDDKIVIELTRNSNQIVLTVDQVVQIMEALARAAEHIGKMQHKGFQL